MYSFLVIIEIIIAVLLILVILMQNSKGGGLSSGFGGGNIGSVFGVRRASDFLSKSTTYLATSFIVIALVINLFFLPGKGKSQESVIQKGQATSVPAAQLPTQTPAPSWGIDRIDQASLPLSGSFTYTADGTGVTAYIIDTGIRLTHAEFTGRIRTGYDAVTTNGSANDCNGHGTHVAGTVGGTTYGIAKKVTLVPVRVLDCGGSGSLSGVIAGIDWAIADHAANVPAVANMSLGGGYSPSLDTAVTNGVADGITNVASSPPSSSTVAAQPDGGISPALPRTAGRIALPCRRRRGASSPRLTARDPRSCPRRPGCRSPKRGAWARARPTRPPRWRVADGPRRPSSTR